MNNFIKGILLLAVIIFATHVNAYDFSEVNQDGVTIYFNILNEDDKTCEVTWMEEGKNLNSHGNFTDYVGDVDIPSSANGYTVTRIGDMAFMGCKELTSVTIPNSVTYIGSGSFYECKRLTSVEIPNSVTYLGGFAFDRCDGLTSVIIGNSVRYIGACAFYECTNLLSISIPNSVTTIMNQAFCSCSSVESITLGNSLQSVGWNAFSGCKGVSSLVIPNSVTRIENSAFSGLSGVTSLIIPKSVTFIGDNPFANCPKLSSIVVEEGNPKYNSDNGCNAIIETSTKKLVSGCNTTVIGEDITAIGSFAFYNCPDLISVEIPNSVTSFGSYSFAQNTNLTSVTLPNSITSLAYAQFQQCSALASITIPNTVTSIGDYAFNLCGSLSEVVMGNSVESIGELAFRGTSIKTVKIPSSVTSIGRSAFWECDSLTSIYSYITEVFETGNTAFYGCTNATLYVPRGLVDSYQSTSDWKRLPIEEMPPAISLLLTCTDQGKVTINDLITFTNDIGEISVNDGIDNTFVFTPNQGYQLNRVLINGLDVTKSINDNQLTAKILPNSKMIVVFSTISSDVNGDGRTDIADVVAIVNFILGQ